MKRPVCVLRGCVLREDIFNLVWLSKIRISMTCRGVLELLQSQDDKSTVTCTVYLGYSKNTKVSSA